MRNLDYIFSFRKLIHTRFSFPSLIMPFMAGFYYHSLEIGHRRMVYLARSLMIDTVYLYNIHTGFTQTQTLDSILKSYPHVF